MDEREMIETLVPQVTRNATVIAIEEQGQDYAVTIAGDTSVTVRCHLPREEVVHALDHEVTRNRLAEVLKRCADETIVPLADGRG